MIYNYHTHTERCGHAEGSDEEFVLSAIEGGIKYLGFSEHIPFAFPDGHESFYRMKLCDLEDYFKKIRALQEKYKDQIHISIGFEMEYYPAYFDEMIKIARKSGADYLVLGQHFLNNEWPDGRGCRAPTESEGDLIEHVNEVIEAMERGVFSCIAHPDTLNFVGADEIYHREMTRLCLAAKKHNIPLEINLHGLKNDRFYPSERFFEIAGEVGAPVIFGYDAHESNAMTDKGPILKASMMVKRLGLNYVGMPKLISILEKN